jgi:hypothetical protein
MDKTWAVVLGEVPLGQIFQVNGTITIVSPKSIPKSFLINGRKFDTYQEALDCLKRLVPEECRPFVKVIEEKH